jgi:glutathione synthase/RimK-type ligase-like ATP-grasp enzyme
MGIRLVYGLETSDLSYLEIFYPSRRLAEAARSMGIDYKATLYQKNTPVGNIIKFCNGHTALLRGELPITLYQELEAAGIFTVNGSQAHKLARDKMASADFFSSLGTKHPRTKVVDISLPQAPMNLPFVLKPRFGKMGRGVTLLVSLDDLDNFRKKYEGEIIEKQYIGQEYLAQEYVAASRGKDLRFFFAAFQRDNKSITGSWQTLECHRWPGLFSVAVLRRGPGFTSNAHSGGTMVAYNAPIELRNEAERIFLASGLIYGTVDFLFTDESATNFTVCEINSCPGFEELERTSGLDVAMAILESAMHADNAAR